MTPLQRLLLILSLSCRIAASSYPPTSQDSSSIPSYDPSTWVITSTSFSQNTFQSQAYSANGYIGVRVPVEGTGYWRQRNESDPSGQWPTNGWPLFDPRFSASMVAGFYDNQPNTTGVNFPELLPGESVIATLPTWSTLILQDEKKNTFDVFVDNSTVSHYRQSFSIRNGVVQTKLTWQPASIAYDITYTVFTHRTHINLGLASLSVNASTNATLTVLSKLDGAGSWRTTFVDKGDLGNNTIYTAVRPNGISNVTAYEVAKTVVSGNSFSLSNTSVVDVHFANASTIQQAFKLQVGFAAVNMTKYVGIASSDAFHDPFAVARQTVDQYSSQSLKSLLQSNDEAWGLIWDDGDIVIPGDQQLQIAVRSTLWNLMANLLPGNKSTGLGDHSIGVGGLGSDSYGGLIFWDADLWMQPGILALHPEYALNINNYRSKLHSQAIANAKKYQDPGAVYPWTSGRFGNCTATGPCIDYEYHINTDIAHSFWNYFLSTGDTNWLATTGYPVIRDAANFFAADVVMNGSTGGNYFTYNLTDPDEFANFKDNGAFTNAAISELMGWATEASTLVNATPSSNWSRIAGLIEVPVDNTSDITKEFSAMNGSVQVKQADAVLLTYPLAYDQPSQRAVNNADFYAQAQSADGPAMTWAIFSIDSSQLASSGCAAYTYLLYSSQPYLRLPFYQFSEQIDDNPVTNGGTNPAFTFLTGHGGFLQTLTHGFTGFRPMYNRLYLNPTLPPQMSQGYQITGMKYLGAVFDIDMQLNATTILRRNGGGPKRVQITVGDRSSQAGNYSLGINETLTVSTGRPDLLPPTVLGNKAQCVPVTSNTTWQPGQFPLAAVDGSNATVWQPTTINASSITINLGSLITTTHVNINWLESPARYYALEAANASIGPWSQFYADGNISVSAAYNASTAAVIQLRGGNTTEGTYSATRAAFIRLTIEGKAWKEQNGGATVAEIALL